MDELRLGDGDGTPVPSAPAPPVALTIAGFDPSGGAGFTADLKVFAAHGLYGIAAPTALTIQSTQGVRRSEAVGPELLRDTLACLAEDIPIAGIKIGMLADEALVGEVSRFIEERSGSFPVVLDPVLASSSGHMLLGPAGLERLRDELLPRVTVVTPNTVELALLAGQSSAVGVEEVAQELQQSCGKNLNILVTGGHLAEPNDYLLEAGSSAGEWIAGERIETTATHGTGCTLSSALLCALIAGEPLRAAARSAKRYVEGAMRAAYPIGRGRGPLHHLFPLVRR